MRLRLDAAASVGQVEREGGVRGWGSVSKGNGCNRGDAFNYGDHVDGQQTGPDQ